MVVFMISQFIMSEFSRKKNYCNPFGLHDLYLYVFIKSEDLDYNCHPKITNTAYVTNDYTLNGANFMGLVAISQCYIIDSWNPSCFICRNLAHQNPFTKQDISSSLHTYKERYTVYRFIADAHGNQIIHARARFWVHNALIRMSI